MRSATLTPAPPPAAAGPAFVRGTAAEAARALRFTVLLPRDPPSAAAPVAEWTRPGRTAAPHAIVTYPPQRRGGDALVVIASAAAPGAPPSAPAVVRDEGPGPALVRVVRDGTLVRVSGGGLSAGGLLRVAASLVPVAPAG